MNNLLFGTVNKVNSGYIIIDFILICFFIFVLNQPLMKLYKYIDLFTSRYDKTNKIIFTASEKESSKRFKAIMHFISQSNNSSVKTLSEILNLKLDANDNYEEAKTAIYRVNQSTIFNIDINISGRVYNYDKEKCEYNGRINYVEVIYLEIFSKKLKLIELEDWIDKKLKIYDDYLRNKSNDNQLLVEISWNSKQRKCDICDNVWKSNVTFDNRFFTNKNYILNKIKFFTDNPDWYNKRGIPYTLGFLLWGEPGCGKTGFIKALMNYTNRHGISIKLNNNFNMNKLKEIIYNETISENIIIPQQNRILILEDIDCMTDIVNDRDTIDKTKNDDKKLDDIELNNIDNFNNNLSYLLNILDGIQECPGRIIIMTTNKPEKLDKALIRPGRIDLNINFTKATIDDIKNIVKFYWDIKNDININELNNMIYSHAEIVNLCRISDNYSDFINLLKYK
jgi:ATP-dependent Zn protease